MSAVHALQSLRTNDRHAIPLLVALTNGFETDVHFFSRLAGFSNTHTDMTQCWVDFGLKNSRYHTGKGARVLQQFKRHVKKRNAKESL